MNKKRKPPTQVGIPVERVQRAILLIRGEKVPLSRELATLYRVSVSLLNQAVKRNRERFPEDFMFHLTTGEFRNLKSQFVTSSWGGIRRARPYAFTEHGVAMLSSVLRTRRAVRVNVAIMRAFVGLRRMLATNDQLAAKLTELECRLKGHDRSIVSILDTIRQLMTPPVKPAREIGFHAIPKA